MVSVKRFRCRNIPKLSNYQIMNIYLNIFLQTNYAIYKLSTIKYKYM